MNMTKYLEMIEFVVHSGEPLAAAILAIPLVLVTGVIIVAAALVLIGIWVAVCMIYESYAKPTPKIRSLPLSPRFSSSMDRVQALKELEDHKARCLGMSPKKFAALSDEEKERRWSELKIPHEVLQPVDHNLKEHFDALRAQWIGMPLKKFLALSEKEKNDLWEAAVWRDYYSSPPAGARPARPAGARPARPAAAGR